MVRKQEKNEGMMTIKERRCGTDENIRIARRR